MSGGQQIDESIAKECKLGWLARCHEARTSFANWPVAPVLRAFRCYWRQRFVQGAQLLRRFRASLVIALITARGYVLLSNCNATSVR